MGAFAYKFADSLVKRAGIGDAMSSAAKGAISEGVMPGPIDALMAAPAVIGGTRQIASADDRARKEVGGISLNPLTQRKRRAAALLKKKTGAGAIGEAVGSTLAATPAAIVGGAVSQSLIPIPVLGAIPGAIAAGYLPGKLGGKAGKAIGEAAAEAADK